MITGQEWQDLYKVAVLETDLSRIGERLQAAESSMAERLRAFSLNHGGTAEENHAIIGAMHRLQILRSEITSWGASKQAG